jgi:hypothetical protein
MNDTSPTPGTEPAERAGQPPFTPRVGVESGPPPRGVPTLPDGDLTQHLALARALLDSLLAVPQLDLMTATNLQIVAAALMDVPRPPPPAPAQAPSPDPASDLAQLVLLLTEGAAQLLKEENAGPPAPESLAPGAVPQAIWLASLARQVQEVLDDLHERESAEHPVEP